MKSKILRLLRPIEFLLTLSVLCGISQGQTGRIQGEVKVTDGSIPPGAKVVLIDSDSGLTRELDSVDAVTGRFDFNNVQEGHYTIVACADATYNPSRLNIEVKEGKVKSAGLTLSLARARRIVKGNLRAPNVDVSALGYGCEVAITKTDARGHFRFEPLPVPPQEYVVRTRLATGALNSNPFRVRTGGETEVNLILSDSNSESRLVAQVVDPNRCDVRQGEQTDLSGTYNGRIKYPTAELSSAATLTITGNDFTLTSASETQTGRITAVTTCGYTAATIRFEAPASNSTKPPPPQPAVSLKVVKSGDSIRLENVRGEKQSFLFTTTAAARPKTRPSRRAP